MSNFGKAFGLLLGLALIAALGWAAFLGLDWIASLSSGLDPQVAKVTAIGAIVALTAAAIIAAAVRRAGEKGRTAQVHAQKIAAYQFFVECWQDAATPSHKLHALDRHLALYGGAAVIKAHGELRTLAREKGARHPDTAGQIGKVLLELRRDLGVQADGIRAQELQHLVLDAQAQPR